MLGIFYPFFCKSSYGPLDIVRDSDEVCALLTDLQVFAAVHGVDANLAFYCLSILNAASVFGRVLPNFLADYFGPANMLVSTAIDLNSPYNECDS